MLQYNQNRAVDSMQRVVHGHNFRDSTGTSLVVIRSPVIYEKHPAKAHLHVQDSKYEIH